MIVSLRFAAAGTLTGSFAIIPPGTSVNLSTNGTLDWVHWGTYTEYAYDRKAGITPIINNYTNVGTDNKGAVSIYQFSDNTNGYTWMDGTPTISITNTTTGLWAYKGVNVGNPKPSDYIGSGFVFSVPADPTLRRLNVYAGAFNGRLRFVATLSDGSAANYSNTTLNNTNNGPSAVYTVTYAANSPGQTLWVTNILAAGNGAIPNVTLQAAALSAVTNNNLPLVWFNSPANYTSFLSPTNATLDVSALDIDGSITNVEFFQSSNKLGEIATAPYTFVWSNAPAGKSILTARATDNAGASRISTPIEVYGYNNGGFLSSTTAPNATNILLNTEGTHDWAHWGSTSFDSFDHRAGVPQLINTFSIIGTNNALRLTNDATRWSWTNGTPIFSITNSATAVYIYGFTNGFELNLPAGTNSRTARIYTGVSAARGKLQASISDASAPMLTDDSFQNFYKNSSRTYVLNYAAASEGQTLKIRYTDVVPFDSDFANIILRSASMDVAAPLVVLTNPANSQHFSHGTNVVLSADAQDWTGTITLVEFFADANKIGDTTNSPYSITWTNPPEGDHALIARATDSNGASGTSLPITIAVATNAKPVVVLTSPASGAHFIEGDLITLGAQSTDADDTQLTVGWYTNGIKLAETSTKPYAITWSNATAGNYTLTAIASDPNGGIGTSAPVSIVVVTNAWPLVTITSPTNGQGFFAPTNITLTAQATDTDGFVSLVEFFDDTNKLGQATLAPYTLVWLNVSKGSHTVIAKATDDRGASNFSSAVSIIVSNRPPTVSLVQPTNGARFFEGTNLTVLANAQDLDGTVMLVEFFDGTNKLGEAAAAPYSLTWSNVARGNYALNAHATDNEGAVTISATRNISVITNTPPSVAISTPVDGQGFTTPVNIPITADATDSDGIIQQVQFFAGTNNIGQATAPPLSIVWSNAPRGNFSLSAIAYDDWNGVTISAPVTIAISNSPPIVSLITPTNSSHFFSPGPITIAANATDADGTVSLVELYESTNKLGEATNAPFVLVWTNVVAGNYTLAAQATDNEGALSISSTISIFVTTNIPPSVTIIDPTNGQGFTTPMDLPITAAPADVDGTVRLVEFFESTNKLGEASNAPFSIVWSNAPRGDISLTAIAHDDWDGVTVSLPVTITISNRPPSISILAPTNGSHFFYPGTISVQAAAADADGFIGLVEFFESTNKIGEATNASFSLVWTNVAAGDYALTAQATDNEGAAMVSEPVNVVVATNIPPTVALMNPTNGATFIEGDIVQVLANAADSDGTIQRIEFFANTNELGESTNAPYSLLWSNLIAGDYALQAIATDDYGDTSASTPITLTVFTNQFPSVTIITPTNGSAFFAPANVPIQATANDVDGTTRLIDLLADNVRLTTSTNNVLSFVWTNASKGSHTLTAIAKDDRGATNVSAAVSLFISNSPPVIAITIPTNNSIFIEGDVIPLQVIASDVDGSITSVQFFESTNQLAAITNPPFSFNWSNVVAGSYALTAIATDNDGISVTSTVVNVTMVTNQFPSVIINSPTNGAAFFAPTNLLITASGSDPDGRIARLELFGDGIKLATATHTPLNFTWTNTPKGPHSLMAVATDDRGASNISAAVTIIVSNQPPTIALISPTNNAMFIEGDVIPIAANASDLDGTNLVVTLFSSTNQLAQLTNGPFTFNWSNVVAGSYTLTAVALDNDGAGVTSAVVNVTMVTNQPPSVTVNSPTNGATFFAPTNLLITASGSDADGRIARLELFGDGIKLATGTNTPLSFTWTNVPKGPHSLMAIAIDDRSASNISAVVNIMVSNRPPTVSLVSPTNNSVFIEGDIITVAATAADIDGTNLVVTLFSSTNQLAQFTNGPFSFSWSNVVAGSYALTAIATDNDGASVTSAVANVTMVTNQFPLVTINSPTNGSAFFAPTNLSITAAGSDADGRISRLDLFADNVKLTSSTNSTLSFTWTNTPKGPHSLSAVATDNRGATNTSPSVSITVSNRPPTIAVTSPTNNSVFIEGDVITVAAAANDLDGTNLVVKFFSATNQLAQITNGPFSFNWSNVLGGSYTLTAIATDNDGASVTSAVVNVTMVTNRFPSAIITSPTNGSAFFAPTNLAITATASDADGRIVRLELFGDNVKLATSTNTPLSFTWTNAPKGGHSLIAVATDDRGATNVSPTINLVVSNRPPAITLISPTNNSKFIVGDGITLSATASDADGTNVLVQFFAGTNLLTQFTNAPYSFIWTNAAIGTYTLTAIATDNDGATNVSSAISITANTNQFPSVFITSPTNSATLYSPIDIPITATATDVDGSITKLALLADGVKLGESTNSPLTLTWSNAPNGTHLLTAMAVDDRQASNTTANAITVIPVAPNITSQPQSQTVIAGTNATFVVTATGSPILKYQWRLNGTNVSSATNSSYTITNAQPTNGGSYSVIVSNSYGAITSSPALLTVNFALNIVSTAGGAVTKSPDRPSYAPGTTVTLTALTNWPYSFTGWSGGLSGTNNPRTVTLNSNLTAGAQFTPFIADLVIDNPQAYATGAWSSATSATNKYGTNYLTVKALQGTSPTATAVYTPNIPGAGGYDIYAWWPTFTKASTSVPIQVSSGGSNVTFFVNQSTGGGAWQLVASNRFFAAGTNGFGRISNDQAPQSLKDIVADAMRWVYATNQTAWPPAILAGPSNQVAIAGSLMNFSIAVVGASPLAYQWRFNGSNIAGETNATLTFAPAQSSHAGNYQVFVTNAAGTATSAVASLTVIVPAQIATQPQSQRVLAGNSALFTVAATGTSPLAYQWRFNTTPVSHATNASLSLTNVQLTNVGSYDVTVTNSGGAATSIVATLSLNSAPAVTLLPTNSAHYIEKDVIGVDVFSSDTDGIVTNILLLADGNSLMQWTGGASNHFNWNSAAAGSHVLKAIVTDNDGATNSASSTITVATNQFPSAAITTPTNGAHYIAPTNLLINASASDADGTVTNLQVRVDGILVLSQTNGNSLSLVWSNALKGSHTLTALAVDDRGATNISAAININVSNRPPTVVLANPTNNSVFIEGDAIPLSATANDADGTNVLVRFLAGTNTLVSLSNAPYSFNWSNVVAGNYALSAAATDNDGATVTSAVVNVTMRTNQFPSAAITTPTNGARYVAPTDLLINATASDADGTVTNLHVRVDGTLMLSQTNGNSLSLVWSNAIKGTHTLTAAAVDDRGATNISVPVTITISNRPPTVALVGPTNNSVFIEGDVIPLAATANDADGTNVLVRLLAGTNTLVSFSNAPYTFNWSNAIAGNYVLSAAATDNDGATITSAVVNVTMHTNQFPSVAILNPTNGWSFSAPANVTILASANDADGTVRLIEVFADGIQLAQSTNSSISFVWTNTPKGSHALTAVAMDDRGATNRSATINLFVTNSPPLVTLVAPTNGSQFIQGDTISMAAAATDPDGIIMSVAFFEATNLLATITNTPFVYAWSNAAPGIYSLTAQATDNDNATVLSSNVTITVVTNQPPVIELLTPTKTETFLSPAAITVTAAASDTDGQVRLVQFFESTNKLSEMTNGPYVFVWTNVLHGNYTLSSVATDDRGAATASAPVQIVVERRTPTLIISNAAPSMSGFTFDFATMPEWTYRIEASDSLQSSDWTVVTNIVGDGTPVSISTGFSTNEQMFYRVVAQ